MDNESRKPGRPLKGRTRRVPVTVYVPTDLLDAIDDYIEEKGGYTRSEFLCAGAEDRLRAIGRLPEEGGDRTENVPE